MTVSFFMFWECEVLLGPADHADLKGVACLGVRIRVAAIVVEAGQVLLVSTKRGAKGYLVPPGGGLEAGETIPAAAAREVAEEAGLPVEVGALLAYRELWQAEQRTLELYVAARPNSSAEAVVSDEERVVRWVAYEDLARLPHFPEQLVELCHRAQQPEAGALWLGQINL